jgi:VRR-NUC domain-containing protein
MRSEEQLHRAVVDLLRIYENRDLLAFCHVGNSEWRHKATGGRLKAMGLRAGVPDLLVWADGGRGFGVELKAGAGKLSPAQTFWHATLKALGHRVYVVRSLDEMEAVLRAEDVPAVGTLDRAMTN